MIERTTLLLVDHNDQDRLHIKNLVEKATHPYNILEAKNGKDALKLAERTPIDCIMIELKLPDLHGFDVMEKINTHQSFKAASIIMTRLPCQSIRAQAARKGAMDYLSKDSYLTPQKLNSLILKVQKWTRSINDQHSAINAY